MPIYQEPTFHDRQGVISESEESTSSTVHVDLPGAAITTKSLSVEGSYISSFSLLMRASLNNTVANFILLINGVPLNNDGVSVKIKTKDLDIGYSLNVVLENIPMAAELKLQYKTDKGTVTISEFNIVIDGVPQSRVVI